VRQAARFGETCHISIVFASALVGCTTGTGAWLQRGPMPVVRLLYGGNVMVYERRILALE